MIRLVVSFRNLLVPPFLVCFVIFLSPPRVCHPGLMNLKVGWNLANLDVQGGFKRMNPSMGKGTGAEDLYDNALWC